MHRWLLRSEYLTHDPSEADYFLMPAYLSLCFYDLEFGLYWLVSPRRLLLMTSAIINHDLGDYSS